jgi:outer membrane immunogenic protein
MKKISLLLFSVLVTVASVAQEKPGTQLNAGLGLSSWGIPIYAGMDFGVAPDITVGFEGSFRSYNQNYTGIGASTIVGLAGNGNYHFNRLLKMPSKFDFYAGLNLGFYFWSTPRNYPGSGTSGIGLGAQVGGRYFFTDKFGLNLEFGGGNAFAGGKFGITYRFK